MNSDTLIIIIIFASLGLLVLVFGLSKLYRSLSATSNPLPPVQPLAHHRQTYYQLHHFHGNSKSSLLDEEYILVDPQPLFRHQEPRPLSSCSTTPSPSLRPVLSIQPRPMSIASESRLSHSPSLAPSSGRRGLPHSPHSQMHVVLPAPLSSSPSTSSLAAPSEFGHVTPRRPSSSSRPNSRSSRFLDVGSEYDRRSMVDRWLPTPSTDSYSLATNYDTPRVPSPLIPLSSSSSSQSLKPKPIPTTLRNPSPGPSNIGITVDPGSDTGSFSTSHSSISISPDSPNPMANAYQNHPMPMPPAAVTADIPIPVDNIPIPSNPDLVTGDNNTVHVVVTVPP